MSVTALVINFNAGEALYRCIQSLSASTVKARVLVIDNASADGSAQRIANLYGRESGVEVTFNPSNIGYAPAINTAVQNLKDEYILVINPDCSIHKEALGLLLEALQQDETAALAAPGVKDSNGKLEKAALRRFPDPWNSLMTMSGLWRLGRWIPLFRGVPINPGALPTETVSAEAVSGACMLIRRDYFLEVGLLDEDYRLHCEDLDLMYRFRQKGWHCLFVPSATAVHEQGVSSRSRPIWVHTQKHKGMARFFRKFQASGYSFPVRWLVYFGIWVRYLLLCPLVWVRK